MNDFDFDLLGRSATLFAVLPAAVVDLTTFMLAVAAVTAPLLAGTIMHRHVTRTCHRCGRRTRLDKRKCTHCGYDSQPVSFRR